MPRLTRPTSAGKVSSLARSPVAPKMTSASVLSDMSVSPYRCGLRFPSGGLAGRRGWGLMWCCRAVGAWWRARLRCGLEFRPAHAAPEHVVGPGLVREDDRQQDDDDDGHHLERVPAGRG